MISDETILNKIKDGDFLLNKQGEVTSFEDGFLVTTRLMSMKSIDNSKTVINSIKRTIFDLFYDELCRVVKREDNLIDTYISKYFDNVEEALEYAYNFFGDAYIFDYKNKKQVQYDISECNKIKEIP